MRQFIQLVPDACSVCTRWEGGACAANTNSSSYICQKRHLPEGGLEWGPACAVSSAESFSSRRRQSAWPPPAATDSGDMPCALRARTSAPSCMGTAKFLYMLVCMLVYIQVRRPSVHRNGQEPKILQCFTNRSLFAVSAEEAGRGAGQPMLSCSDSGVARAGPKASQCIRIHFVYMI